MMKMTAFVCSATLAVGAATGCERSGSGADAPTQASASVLPAGLFAPLPADEAVSVLDAKSAAKEGDSVLVRGRIGGSGSPFVDGRAMFTIVDASMLACSDTPGDSCKTPWDYCCEPAADIAAHAATVRVTDDDGATLRASLKGQGGLAELSTVLVRGTVAQADGIVLVIDATEIATVGR
ncbi:MAG: hypothetical protein ACTS27_00490 [Phycisphaerales bacterium]